MEGGIAGKGWGLWWGLGILDWSSWRTGYLTRQRGKRERKKEGKEEARLADSRRESISSMETSNGNSPIEAGAWHVREIARTSTWLEEMH